MYPLTAAVTILITLVAGTAAVWARRADPSKRHHRMTTIIGLFFAVVALVSIADLHHRITVYIAATQPRDAAQEQCARDTLSALRSWVQARLASEDEYRARDNALRPFFDAIGRGQPVTPEMTTAVVATLDRAETARSALERVVAEHPLPECDL